MNYQLIPMTSEHLDQVAEIEGLCFSDPWSRRMLSEHLENECAATIVAQGEDGTDEGYITNVAVRPEYRRQGVASQLLEAFRRFGEGSGFAFLTLEVRASNTAARALYTKHGYAETGCRKNYYEHPKEDAIIMTLEFTQDGTETADGR